VSSTGSADGIGKGIHTEGSEVSFGVKCEASANAVRTFAWRPCFGQPSRGLLAVNAHNLPDPGRKLINPLTAGPGALKFLVS
jgi:hypothetical protein